ncbi:MAG TPA: heavy metal transporter [Bacteroidetes bacterium]|nr:heavy metal transporter [Bacteroidota bacterium]
MKNLLILLVFVLPATTAFAQKKNTDTLIVKTTIHCDHCKECESCQPRIENKLSYVKGIVDYQVNTENQTILVIYKPKKTNPEAIRKAIASSGFDADEVKADPKAVEKLDGCCKPK